MKITKTKLNGRVAVRLQSDTMQATVLLGGGHVAELRLAGIDVNPMWQPHWKSIEPGSKPPARLTRGYGPKVEAGLLASIAGHNVCLAHFGPPSDAEAALGLQVHGEIGLTRWQVDEKEAGDRSARLVYGCTLQEAGMEYSRALALRSGESILYFRDTVKNLSGVDKVFTWTQHCTVGAPFVQHGVTVFDCPGTRCKVMPGEFAPRQRLKPGSEFRWPNVRVRGKKALDMRRFPGKPGTGDFVAVLMDPKEEYAWTTAANPEVGLLVGYLWPRAAYPWLGIWEENMVRTHRPWAGKELTRGLEFGVSPFPLSKRDAVDMHKLFDTPTYRWLDAKGETTVRYLAFLAPIDKAFKGVRAIELAAGRLIIRERGTRRAIALRRSGAV